MLLKKRQLLPEEEVLRSQAQRECPASTASRTRSNTTIDNVPQQYTMARKSDDPGMNAQDCTSQSVYRSALSARTEFLRSTPDFRLLLVEFNIVIGGRNNGERQAAAARAFDT